MSCNDKMYSYFELKNTNMNNVLLPWDDNANIIVEDNVKMKKWDFIRRELQKPIRTLDQLIDLIKRFNVIPNSHGKLLKPPWKFTALIKCFHELHPNERCHFFQEHGVLSNMANLVLEANEIISSIKLLKSGMSSSLTLHQLQIASLLACGFLCIFSKRDAEYPSINFNKLFDGGDLGNPRPCIEKIKCILHYFRRIHERHPCGYISFYRLHIPDSRLPRWDKTTASLCYLKVDVHGKIEDQEDLVQMDFANRFVGGGVLGRGCLQEEIRFVINPELIVARLFTQCLDDNEALFVVGTERYCQYEGFGDTFRFIGDYRDATPFNHTNHRKTYILVLDALQFNHKSEQYRESKILRELKKAYVGFKPVEGWNPAPLATGNWGCGAFKGDPQLKSVLQVMAASEARRDMLYLTFGDSALKKEIEELYKILKDNNIDVGALYRIIRLYGKNKLKNQKLFDFIHDAIVKKSTSTTESDIETQAHQSRTLSEPNAYYTSFNKRIRTCSFTNKDQTIPEETKTYETDKTTLDKVETDSSPEIEDGNKSECRDWTFDFGDADIPMENAAKVESEPDSDIDMLGMDLASSAGVGAQESHDNKPKSPEISRPTVGRHRIVMNDFDDIKRKQRKLIQTKITDCFSKK